MSDAMTGELLDRDLVDRHNDLLRQLVYGVATMCIALHTIRKEKTFTTQGCRSFTEFLKLQGISVASGRLYASAGPIFLELKKTDDDLLIKHVDMLKPIYKMKNPVTQANIVKIAPNPMR